MIDPAILKTVERRIDSARDIYGDLSSSHEALGVAMEELQELIEAIHDNDIGNVRREACDLAAICLRLAEACASPSEAFAKRSGFVESDSRWLGCI